MGAGGRGVTKFVSPLSKSFQSSAIGICAVALVVAGFGILLAIFWTIFPFMVWSKMNRVIEVLQAIRDQK